MLPRISNLASQTAIYGISAILSKFLNYMLTPYFTRILSDGVYGEVNLIYGAIPFINVLLTMGFSTAYFRWAAKADTPFEQKRIFSTLWGVVGLASLIFFALCSIFGTEIIAVMQYGDNVWYLTFVAALIAIDNIAAIPLAALRQQGRAMRYTIINVTAVVVNIVACYLLYTFMPDATSSAAWAFIANLIASATVLLMLMPTAVKLLTKNVSWKILKKVAAYSMPLMIAGLMGVGSDFLDRQMLRWMSPFDVGLAQVGIYSAAAKIAALMIIFRQIYTLGAEPFFLQNFSKDDFKRMNAAALKYFTIVGIAIFLFLTYFSDIFALIIGENFREGMDVVPILVLANLLMGILVNLSFWYKVVEKTRYALYVTMTGFVTVIVASYFLIPVYGYMGAAWSHLAASVVMVVMSYVFNQINYRVDYQVGRLALYALAGAVLYYGGGYVDRFGVVVGICSKILLLLLFVIMALRVEKIDIRKIWKR